MGNLLKVMKIDLVPELQNFLLYKKQAAEKNASIYGR
jgi:hypothetical protein